MGEAEDRRVDVGGREGRKREEREGKEGGRGEDEQKKYGTSSFKTTYLHPVESAIELRAVCLQPGSRE